MSNFRNLDVWGKSIELVSKVYAITSSVDDVALRNQIRRAVISIPANISEGCARSGNKEFKQFLIIARGSVAELETFLEILKNLNLVNTEDIKNLLNDTKEIGMMINGLIRSIKEKLKTNNQKLKTEN